MTPSPEREVSVVVASHERADRLRILLDALAAQTLDRGRWELVVVHTYDTATAADLLDAHPLARAGTLRHLAVDRATAGPALQRNRGWRGAHAPLIAFTDDDCRPEPDWLERLLAVAQAHPDAFVQGATKPDPRDGALGILHVRTVEVDPPNRFMQTCNILYPRALLERLGGLDEHAMVGEDLDLGLRAKAAGAPLVAAPGALVWHAVEPLTLRGKIRANAKWADLAYVVKVHPELRRECALGVWYKPEHLRAAVALAALLAAPRRPWLLAGVLPYYRIERLRFGRSPRGRLRAVWSMPSLWLVELAEIGTFIRGSVRHRSPLL